MLSCLYSFCLLGLFLNGRVSRRRKRGERRFGNSRDAATGVLCDGVMQCEWWVDGRTQCGMDGRWAVEREKGEEGWREVMVAFCCLQCCQVVTEGQVCGWWKLHRPPSLVGQHQLEVSGIVIGAKR